ncbi:YafY family transcriptional regulator [Nocardia yamanashiensis]|uniref:helix-turn-helix transcriptional regulator n=1 Tax=Nocardia yamanashiensis TaxID=209247 RepID=UPI001E600361|nr:YafY family protein [Nocardia yamanashiensis]UGT40640.1 YafY family transcriptional regulator [Nocardia yamanashiensis]
MTKTERLYALAEELRAYSPRPRTARQLAARFEVTARTIVRDIAALQQAGLPIITLPGRNGGYALERARTLGPVSLTATEATALLVALPQLAGTPFAAAARSAVHKVLAVLTEHDRELAAQLSDRIRLLPNETPPAPPEVLEAVLGRRVLRLEYVDGEGRASAREVEPLALLAGEHWYLSAWCRLRDGIRGFRLDRVRSATVLAEVAPDRGLDSSAIRMGDGRLVDVTAITDIPLSRNA